MMWRNTPLRTLLVIYAIVVIVSACEYFRVGGKKRIETDIYGDRRRNFPEAMSKLYPGTPEAEYMEGRRFESLAGKGYDQEAFQRDPEQLREFVSQMNANLREAAKHYERAIQMGFTSDENLLYNYALTLMRIQAEPAQIDSAIALWRRHFPWSVKRDLAERRIAIEKQLRQLPVEQTTTTLHMHGLKAELVGSIADAPNVAADPVEKSARDAVSRGLNVDVSWKRSIGYAGSNVCRQCHVSQFDSYHQTGHSQAMAEVRVNNEPPDAVFEHAASGRRYHIKRQGSELIHQETLPDVDGSEFVLTRTPVRYRIGSGHNARTYLCDAGGGFLFESPVTWYELTQKWGMTPNFDKPRHRSFSRQIKENCLSCHAGQVETGSDSDFRLKIIENSIGCERCHGPAQKHVDFHASPIPESASEDPIVNPGRLNRQLSEAICRQCHLQGDIHIEGPARRATDYRPGDHIERFSTVYRMAKNDGGMTVVGHVEQMTASACYQKSETLTCITCHQPHSTIPGQKKPQHFRDICLKCHADQGCRMPEPERVKEASNDCLKCHMPKSATEVPHIAFTHHHIGIHPLQTPAHPGHSPDDLIPLSDLTSLSEPERRRSQMLARLVMYLKRGPEFHQSERGRQLHGEITEWLKGLRPDEVDAEVSFNKTQFLLAAGDLNGAVETAKHALKNSRLRSEEAAALLEQLGQIELRNYSLDVAQGRFEKLIQLRCQGTDWFHLGMCLTEQRPDSQTALHAFERATQLEPAALPVRGALRQIYHARKALKAESEAIKAIQILESFAR